MSAQTVIATAPTPGAPAGGGARVIDIRSAPSVRRRLAAEGLEDPAARRAPVRPRSARPALTPRSFVVGSLAAVALLLGSAGLGALMRPAAYDGPTYTHAVTAGESVWSLAQSVRTSRPLDEVVADIERLNGVDGALRVGQVVVLPAR